jgi:hypothetical protein
MKAKDFDKKFDEGEEDVINDLDLSSIRRPNQKPRVSQVPIYDSIA